MASHTDKAKDLKLPAMSRRSLLLALPAMPLAMRAMAQQAAAQPIPTTGLHSFELRVSDLDRSVEFYQGLFGCPVLTRIGDTVSLGVGNDGQYFTLAQVREGEQPNISNFGLRVPGYTRYQLQSLLSEHGINRTVDSFYDSRTSAMQRANMTWLRRLPGESDTMLADNHELFVADRDGVPIKLSSPDDCGAGDESCTPEPAPTEGLIELREINHLTTFVANYQLSNEFYRRLFGLENQAFQAQFPTLGLGNGTQFLMFVGGMQDGVPAQTGRIDHVSLNIENFTVASVLERLTEYGLSTRGDGEPGPLQHWVTMRMPERGGAEPDGTPEVYFSDPDGLHLQLQHHTYCGGGDEFGGTCSA
ncbi:MAG: hypothetical protein CMQ46_08440 [Gammaproteobacteria bacterium]|nr:hypothetical protein [Gammaproteobacteria bacterium]MBJ54133.1 hypothetical protein [Gammaproteobacteria bacterium]MBJ55273.1 hypothetical protein [Gammaproteobacteria bacterium]HBN14075.1 hypothetical protein [Pseudohongiella sp.]